MSLNATPSSERIHIAFFGRRNAGKSSVVNAVTGQALSVVSDVKGTTTDPVYKAMELLPLGPVMIVDTAGIDDEGELGQLRVEKSLAVLAKTDIAVLVVDGTVGLQDADRALLAEFEKRKLPYLIVYNKSDLTGNWDYSSIHEICVSAKDGTNILALRERMAAIVAPAVNPTPLLEDLVSPGDLIVLVIPIDESAPKGRLILPQQQVIRAALEAGAVPVCCKDTELALTLQTIPSPRMVITDSQAFGKVSKNYDKAGIDGLCAADLTTSLYGDYGKKHITRADSMQELIECYAQVDDRLGNGLLAENANAYALPYVNRIKDVPLNSSRFDIFDEDIPFYQLVMHGLIPYAVSAVNGSPDPETMLLMAAATGSGITYDMMDAEPGDIMDTEFDIYYYADCVNWTDTAAAEYELLRPVLADVSTSTITGYERSGDKITAEYSNGTVVKVDLGKKTIDFNGRVTNVEDFAKEMAKLCGKADIILPNMTEASYMLGIDYVESGYDEAYVKEVLYKLSQLGAKNTVLTGVSFEKGKLGVMAYNSESGEYFSYFNDEVDAKYHGTGDVFASCCTSALMNDLSLADSLKIAADYTARCIQNTMDDPDRRTYGVNFEAEIPYLVHRLEQEKN